MISSAAPVVRPGFSFSVRSPDYPVRVSLYRVGQRAGAASAKIAVEGDDEAPDSLVVGRYRVEGWGWMTGLVRRKDLGAAEFAHVGEFAKTSDSRFPHRYPLPVLVPDAADVSKVSVGEQGDGLGLAVDVLRGEMSSRRTRYGNVSLFATLADWAESGVPAEQALVLVVRMHLDCYAHAEPVANVLAGRRSMSGGSFLFSTDPRFLGIANGCPISLHDHVE